MKTTHILTAVLSLALAACGSHQDDKPGAEAQDTPATGLAGVMVDSVNYSHERATQYTLYDLGNGQKTPVGGSIVDSLIGGGQKNCCLNLPRTWHPGIKLRVEWQEADTVQIFPERWSRDLELPRYAHPADVYVVFYPGHEVEVLVSPAEPGHPEWAGRIKQTPWERCVEEHGRKVCKRAIPHAGLSLEEMQGLCTYFHGEKLEDADLLCQRTLDACIRNYEDEPMCKKLVWEAKKK